MRTRRSIIIVVVISVMVAFCAYVAWKKRHRLFPPRPPTGVEQALEAAHLGGYDVIGTPTCVRWVPDVGDVAYDCDCDGKRVVILAYGVMGRDSKGVVRPVFVYCRSCEPDRCSVTPEDWRSWRRTP